MLPTINNVEIREEDLASLATYCEIPISFSVSSRLVFDEAGKESVQSIPSFIKDYDLLEHPSNWPLNWNLENWGIISAYIEERRVGGAVMAWNTTGVNFLEGRKDLAALWDIRVHPDSRGRGVGRALFHAAEDWAIARNCIELKIETQDINVGACRFYRSMGCTLKQQNPDVYPGLDEMQLIWVKKLK